MPDIVEQAAEVVERLERAEVIRRIDGLMSKFPNGLVLFVISDGGFGETTTIETASNTNPGGVLWLTDVVASAIMRDAVEESDD